MSFQTYFQKKWLISLTWPATWLSVPWWGLSHGFCTNLRPLFFQKDSKYYSKSVKGIVSIASPNCPVESTNDLNLVRFHSIHLQWPLHRSSFLAFQFCADSQHPQLTPTQCSNMLKQASTIFCCQGNPLYPYHCVIWVWQKLACTHQSGYHLIEICPFVAERLHAQTQLSQFDNGVRAIKARSPLHWS